MAELGVFYRNDFDAGVDSVALYHAQITAAKSGFRLSLHTFEGGSLADSSQQAPYIDGMLTFGPEPIDIEFLRVYERPSVICERVVPGCAYVAPDNFDMGRTAANHLLMLNQKRRQESQLPRRYLHRVISPTPFMCRTCPWRWLHSIR